MSTYLALEARQASAHARFADTVPRVVLLSSAASCARSRAVLRKLRADCWSEGKHEVNPSFGGRLRSAVSEAARAARYRALTLSGTCTGVQEYEWQCQDHTAEVKAAVRRVMERRHWTAALKYGSCHATGGPL